MRIFLGLFMIPVFAIALSACNTIKGAGEDIQKGGAAISDTAQDAKG